MLFDWDMPSIVGELLVYPDYPFVNQPIQVPNDTTYIQASAGSTLSIQASAGSTLSIQASAGSTLSIQASAGVPTYD